MTTRQISPVPGPQIPEERVVAEGRVNAGMVTIVDAADIPNNAVLLAKNVRLRYDALERRPALTPHSPAKPNSDKILKLASFKDLAGNLKTYRFTASNVYKRNASSWSLLTGTLNGLATDRIQVASVKDTIVFTNNGADEIQKLDSAGTSYAQLGNAPKYKYVAAFYDRILGAHRVGGGNLGVEVGWSGLGVYDEWDGSVDISAGNNPLLDDTSGLGDLITGIYSFTNVAIIPKERSIWIATKNASGQNPFNFVNRVPTVGFDVPYSISPILNGIAGLDLRTGTVWAYRDDNLERIGTNVEKDIIRSIEHPDYVFSSFNYRRNEFTIYLSSSTSTVVKAWTYSFNTPGWVYDEYDNINSIDEVDLNLKRFKVNDLIGKVNNLLGKVNALGGLTSNGLFRLYGKSNGDIDEETDVLSDDEAEIVSKIYTTQSFDDTVNKQFYKFSILAVPCIVKLWCSKNGGKTWILLKTKTFNSLTEDGTELLTFIKNIYSRQYQWKLTCSAGQFQFKEYTLKSVAGGESRV